MVQIVMRYKVFLTEAVNKYKYCHIKISNNGKGITVTDLDDKIAIKIIKKYNLELVKDLNGYNDGRVYDDGQFKDFVNSRPRLKRNLINLINKIDE